MNTHHTHGNNGGNLDEGLDKLGQAYGELEQDSPPDLLDQAILNRAHRAVEKKSGWMQFGWLHGLTTAAVFVLAFSIFLNQREPLPVDKSLILESSPAPIRSEPIAEDRVEEAPAAGKFEMKAQRAASGEAVLQKVGESHKESLPLKDVLSASPAPREMESMLQEEAAPRAKGVSPDAAEADMAATPVATGRNRQGGLDDETVDVEQQLIEIIRLKQAGDEEWKKALESFRQQYPNYPLPAELED